MKDAAWTSVRAAFFVGACVLALGMAGSPCGAARTRSGAALALMLVGCGASVSTATEPRSARHVASAPARDADGDRVVDARDACPRLAEDVDGFQDDDGCPDVDNDADRMVDADDRCPNDPETYNGHEDEDGCPDRPICIVADAGIPSPLPTPVRFARGSATLDARTQIIVESIAATLAGNPDVLVLGLVGHADPGERRAVALSLHRAEAVRDALLAEGVEPTRLAIFGAGDADPVADPATPEGAERNRRVELHVMTTSERALHRWDGARIVPVD